MDTLCSDALNTVNSLHVNQFGSGLLFTRGMKTCAEIRRENLIALASQFGSMAALLRATKRSDRDATFSQVKTGHRSMGDDLAREIEERLDLEVGWMDHDQAAVRKAAEVKSPPLFAEEEVLLDDYRSLPEGWKFYIRHKAGELAGIARSLPPFLFESMRPLPADASYWQWEENLNEFVRQQREGRNHDHEEGQKR